MIYYALLLFFVLEYARPGSYIPGLDALRLNSLVPILVVLGTMFTHPPVSNAEVMKESNTKLIGFLLGLIALSVLTAEVTLYAWDVFKAVVGYVLVYWAIGRQVGDLQRLKGLFRTLVVVHLLLAAMTPEMFTDPDTRHYIAAGTFLGDGNDFALSVNLVIPFALFLMLEARTIAGRVVSGGALLVLVLCVVATQSRGGTLALVFTGAYYWCKSDKKVVTGLLGIAGLAAVLVFAPPEYFERMDTISSYETDGSAQGRITAWKAGTAMALSNPLLGVGAGQFPGKFVEFAPAGPSGPEVRWKTAHSIYFLILGELGFPGLGLLLGFIVSNLVTNRRQAREFRKRSPDEQVEGRLLACLSASLLAYAIAGAFLSATYYPHMFVLGGLLVAARRIARTIHSSSDEGAVVDQPATITYHWALRRPAHTRAS